MSEIDLFLPNMRGSSVQRGTQVHALFLLSSKPLSHSSAASKQMTPKPAATDTPAPHPWLVRRQPKA